MKLHFLKGLFCLLPVFAVAQSVEKANEHFLAYEYSLAIPLYEKIVARDTNDVSSWCRLANSYRLTNDIVNAERCYAKVVRFSGIDNIYFLYYAEALLTNGKHEKAQKWFEAYRLAEPDDIRSLQFLKAIKERSRLMAADDLYIIQKLNINSDEADFGAVMYKDGIVFASARPLSGGAIDKWTGHSFLSLYFSKGSGPEFSAPVLFAANLQGKFNNGPAGFNAAQDELYFTRNGVDPKLKQKGKDKTVKLQLYSAKVKNGNFEDAVAFKYNSNFYSCAHPALNKDGSRLYFSSDMPGSLGGMDLWVCTREGNEWGQPKNMGPSINTKGNEVFPSFSDDGTFYFSSDGRMGIGGLDIYSVDMKNSQDLDPVNMGTPVNSIDDDFGVVLGSNGNGYFSSNRASHGLNDDIYSLKRNTIRLNGIVTDKQSGVPVDAATVKIMESDMVVDEVKTGADGRFTTDLIKNKEWKLVTSHTGHKTDTMSFSTAAASVKSDSTSIHIYLDQPVITIGGKAFSASNNKPLKGARIKLINAASKDTVNTISATDGSYSFSVVDPEQHYRVTGEMKNCVPSTVDTATVGIVSNTFMKLDVRFYCTNENIVLRNILYDLNKSDIRPDAALELDKLVSLMDENPTMKIELSSHTDCRESAAYNQKLSQSRANSAVEYIVAHGVERSRLVAKGYGESRLLNKCACEGGRKVPCTEEEHQVNRRTEFKIISIK